MTDETDEEKEARLRELWDEDAEEYGLGTKTKAMQLLGELQASTRSTITSLRLQRHHRRAGAQGRGSSGYRFSAATSAATSSEHGDPRRRRQGLRVGRGPIGHSSRPHRAPRPQGRAPKPPGPSGVRCGIAAIPTE